MAFSFPCFRVLKRKLGALDAVCECMELAAREFANNATTAPSLATYIAFASAQHGVKVDSVNLPLLRTHSSHLYIVSVHQSLEEFLGDLRREHPAGKTWDMGGEDDLLTKTAHAAGLLDTLAFETCQYYRILRNAFAHPAARAKVKKDLNARCNVLRPRALEHHRAGCATWSKIIDVAGSTCMWDDELRQAIVRVASSSFAILPDLHLQRSKLNLPMTSVFASRFGQPLVRVKAASSSIV